MVQLAGCLAVAQEHEQAASTASTQAVDAKPDAKQNACVQPEPFLTMQDYTGPFSRVVLYLARKPEIKTVHTPLAQAGSRVCAINAGQKFHLFTRNTFEPVTVLVASFNAGISQAQNSDPGFGQGAQGYGKRFGASIADQASGDFFHTVFFPVVFHQDPRYYRQGEGSGVDRAKHALAHVFVAHRDSGTRMFNFSEWMGTVAAEALSNTYHPGNRRGAGALSERAGISIGTDIGFDVLREFWPETVRKFKLPFKERDASSASPVTKLH